MSKDKETKDNLNMDINVNVSYVDESDIVNGHIIPTELSGNASITSNINLNGTRVEFNTTYSNEEKSGYNLQDWIADYQNGTSSEDILNKIKDSVKQNPQIIAQYMSSMSDMFYDHYKKHHNTGTNAQEMLDIMLNTPADRKIDGFVCMNIHEFGMRVLNEIGIEAVCLCGKAEDSENHATLLYKNENGKYTFVNYGQISEIQAPNIKEAAREVYRNSAILESCGYITFIGDKGSYQEFAFRDEAIWGKEMDKRDYNSSTIFGHNIQEKSSIDINASLSNHLSSEITLGTTILNSKENTTKQYSLDLGFKQQHNRKTSLADGSTSIGAKFTYDAIKKETKLGDLKYGTKAIVSETILNFKDMSCRYFTPSEKIRESLTLTKEDALSVLEESGFDTSSPDTEFVISQILNQHNSLVPSVIDPLEKKGNILKNKSYNTSILSRSYINSSGTIYKDQNNEISRFNEINGLVGATADFSGEAACFGDIQIGTEHGLQTKNKIHNTVFQNEVSIGAIGNLKLRGGNEIPSIMAGGKFNFASSIHSKPAQNIAFGARVSGYAIPTNAYTDLGASANAYVSYKPKGTSTAIFGAANVGYKQQTIHLGFNEQCENQTVFGGTLGVDIKNKTKIALSYQGLKDKINPTRNNSQVSLNATFNL